MNLETLEKKLNEFIVKASEIKEEVIKLMKAAYQLKQEIDDEKRIQTDNTKL